MDLAFSGTPHTVYALCPHVANHANVLCSSSQSHRAGWAFQTVTKPIARVHDTENPCLQPSTPQLEPRFAPRNSSLPRVFFYLEWLLVLITAVPQRSIIHCRLLSVPSTKGRNQGRVHTIPIHTRCRACRMLCISAVHSTSILRQPYADSGSEPASRPCLPYR